jgi:hypothetical protein
MFEQEAHHGRGKAHAEPNHNATNWNAGTDPDEDRISATLTTLFIA